MKKIFLGLLFIATLTGITVQAQEAKVVYREVRQLHQDGGYQKNGWWDRMWGMDLYTYAEVYSEVGFQGNTKFVDTYCNGGGGTNCRSWSKENNPNLPTDANGNQIIDAQYMDDRISEIEIYLMKEVQDNGQQNGTKSFNDIHNGYTIYQNLEWNTNEDNSVDATIHFVVVDDN